MKKRNKAVRWHLDVFLFAMVALLVFLMWAELPENWYGVIEIMWPALVLCGMSVWIWVNWEALQEEDQQTRRYHNRQAQSAPCVPLTPVQQHFLGVMNITNEPHAK